jgi:hypothetical protein
MIDDKQLAIGVIKDLLVVPLIKTMIFTGIASKKCLESIISKPSVKQEISMQENYFPERPNMTKKIYQQALEMDKIISVDNYILDISLSSVPENKLVEAVIMAESNNNPNAVSKMGAKGKMQIMPETLRDYNKRHKTNYTEEDLMNPIINEEIGREYLFERLPKIIKSKKIPLSLYTVLASYNRGAENVKKWLTHQEGEFYAQPKETQGYVKKIYVDLGFSLDI